MHLCPAAVGGSSCTQNPQHLQAVIDLGLMLSTTAEMTAPAAFAPSTRACSTCKAQWFMGQWVPISGWHPPLLLPLPSPSGPSHPGVSSYWRGPLVLSYISKSSQRPSQGGICRQVPNAGQAPFPPGHGTSGLFLSQEPFSIGSASRVVHGAKDLYTGEAEATEALIQQKGTLEAREGNSPGHNRT